MKSVLLRLEGPLQSWGTRSRFGRRDTEMEPSKSGVIGLVCAALGVSRDDDGMLARLVTAGCAVRVDREGTLLTDYHTAGDGTFRGKPYQVHGMSKGAILTHRDYLQGASFVVALGWEEADLAERVHGALERPHWPLALGRRACVPSLPVWVRDGLSNLAPDEAVRASPFLAAGPPEADLRLVLECGADDDGASPRQDVPLSFRLGARRFARRHVRIDWLDKAAVPLVASKEEACISCVGC